MRQELDLYICLRPCRAFRGNPLNYREDIDLVVFRENTEGMYIGVEFPQVPESFRAEPAMKRIPVDAAISIRSVTREASRRMVWFLSLTKPRLRSSGAIARCTGLTSSQYSTTISAHGLRGSGRRSIPTN